MIRKSITVAFTLRSIFSPIWAVSSEPSHPSSRALSPYSTSTVAISFSWATSLSQEVRTRRRELKRMTFSGGPVKVFTFRFSHGFQTLSNVVVSAFTRTAGKSYGQEGSITCYTRSQSHISSASLECSMLWLSREGLRPTGKAWKRSTRTWHTVT